MSTRSAALVDIADALDLIAEAERLDQAPSVGQRAFDAVLEQRSRGGAERGFEVGIRALLTTATTPQLLSTLQPQMPSAVQRRLFVRDLLPSLPADAGLIPFVRELNPLTTEGGASAVAEGAVKPDAAGSILFDLRATAPGRHDRRQLDRVPATAHRRAEFHRLRELAPALPLAGP